MNTLLRAFKTSDSPWVAPLRKAAKRVVRAEVPYIRGVHDLLYHAHMFALLGLDILLGQEVSIHDKTTVVGLTQA